MRASYLRTALLCGTAVQILGCSVSGPAFQKATIPDGKSVIYVYRPSSFFGAALRPRVSCGGDGLSLGPGGYRPLIVEPGTRVCEASTEATSEVDVTTKAGEERFVKEEIGWGFFVGRPHLYLVENQTAESEIKDCQLQELE